MDEIEVRVMMMVPAGGPAPAVPMILYGHTMIHPVAPQPPAGVIAVGQIQVHLGAGVIPHAPVPPVINHPNVVPNVPPDDEIMAGIQPEDPNVVAIMEIDEVDQRGRF